MTNRPLRIALISEHASPLATIGGIDAGGQNIYVLNVAKCLARMGHHVDVLTRRDDPALPTTVDVRPGMRVVHLPGGPPAFVPKEKLLRHMPAFAAAARELLQHSVDYDVIHANFFMSGLVGLRLKEIFGTPLAMTFHALGLVRQEHQGPNDGFPPVRIDIERSIVRGADRLIAECPQDRTDLCRLYGARPDRISTVPCGVDLTEFAPGCKADARRALGLADDEFVILQLGRMVPRKGVDNVIRALGRLGRETRARVVIVGGESASPDAALTPEIGRLQALAAECGVADRVTFA
ncbi:MAG: glycosyltransferase, partial [Caldimonas sp.]